MAALVFSFEERRNGFGWYTWEPRWRSFVQRFGRATLPEVKRSEPDLRGNGRWSLPGMWRIDLDAFPASLRDELFELATELWEWSPPDCGVLLLRRMTEDLNGSALEFMTALREALAVVAGDDTAAMHLPIGAETGTGDGTFPLHPDLFQTALLWCLFDDVRGPHGATRLLSVEDYAGLVDAHVPPEVRDRLLRWVRREELDPSTFDAWTELTYAVDYTAALRNALDAAATVIHFGPGEGYLVHDAQWLHGREWLPKEAATYRRLLRLSFDTRVTRAQRPSIPPAAAGE